MRAFFGLEIEAATALQIAEWRDRQLIVDGRPVPPANFHITLAFIGELAESSLERLCRSVDEWLERDGIQGADLDLQAIGYWQKPGIYWLGPQTWPQQLSQLATKLAGLAARVGGKRDRSPYQPHITLFRGCNTAPPAPVAVPPISLPYRQFALLESRQGKSGVSYHPLHHWDLLPPQH